MGADERLLEVKDLQGKCYYKMSNNFNQSLVFLKNNWNFFVIFLFQINSFLGIPE